MDLPVTGLVSRAELLARGYTDDEVRRLRLRGELTTLRPGAYLDADDDRLQDPTARHGLAVRAVLPRLGSGAVVSHISAAVLHRLPVWAVPLDLVHVTRDRQSGGRRSRCLHLHAAALDADEVVLIDGVWVTSLARTIADLARTLPFAQAVVIADAALHRGLWARADRGRGARDRCTSDDRNPGHGLTLDELSVAVERAANRRGNTRARRVVTFADGRSESVGESRSRVGFSRFGIPVPALQREVWSAQGRLLGRVDFLWEEAGVIGEFDGRAKYGRLLRPGQDPAEVLWQEKRREDALRDTGRGIARWYWDELATFEVVATRVRRAFARS